MPDRVTIGYLTRGEESSDYAQSLQDLRDWDREKGGARLGSIDVAWRIRARAGVNISHARNQVAYRFLHLPHKPEWLLMVDDDMAFPADALEVMLAHANPERLIGGLCFAWGTEGDIVPTVFWKDEVGRYKSVVPGTKIPPDTLMQVGGTGTAFMLVHRDALIAMAKLRPASPNPWFRDGEVELVDPETGDIVPHWMSEDLQFCDQATTAGLTIWVHTGLEVKHRKAIWLTRALYESDTSAIEWA